MHSSDRPITNTALPEIGPDDFARRYSVRSERLMWLLGAGASAAAGIPTAGDMIWEFKQQLFVSQRRVSLETVADLANEMVRHKLQSHIDSSGRFPTVGAPDEYAALFEAVWSAERDRQAYIDSKIGGAKPSYGHVALATLMHGGKTRLVWTTNFDPLVEDAVARVYGGTGQLTVATLDAAGLAEECIVRERWPLEIKLHGDFRSRRLKNTSDELRHQDQRLRQALVDSSRNYGLIVAGYSGRDDSIMDTLTEALKAANPFPAGLFWLHRGEDPPLPRVQAFLHQARETLPTEAALVRIENFDETLRDLVRITPGLDTKALDTFAGERRRWTSPPRLQGNRGWPVLRLNALPVQAPTVCRRVVCEIGGYRETREAVEAAGVDVLVARRANAVLAYGSDRNVRAAFEGKRIAEFDLHTIETRRLRHESAERGLLREALSRAIARGRGMDVFHRRRADLLAPTRPIGAQWKGLKQLVGELEGKVPGTDGLTWREGISLQLDWTAERLWLLFEPRTVFEGNSLENRDASTDFARERAVRRYNRQLNDLLGYWAERLAGDGTGLGALGIGDGVDAVFTIGGDTAFSRRMTS